MPGCLSWAVRESEKCATYRQDRIKQCCNWWPCSWLCRAWYYIVNFVCILWIITRTSVCLAWDILIWPARWIIWLWNKLRVAFGRASIPGVWDVTNQDSQVLAIHACLLPTGRVLYFGGDQYDEHPAQQDVNNVPFNSRLWDPDTHNIANVGGAPADLFCSGHALLPSGRLLVVGGTEQYPDGAPHAHGQFGHFIGLKKATVFDWQAGGWRPIGDLKEGRWYPTCVTVPDGRVAVLSGHGAGDASSHESTLLELYDETVPPAGSWSSPRAFSPPLEVTGGTFNFIFRTVQPMVYYPRLIVVPPSGHVFSATALRVQGRRRTVMLNLDNATVQDLGDPPPGGDGSDEVEEQNVYSRSSFPAVLCPLDALTTPTVIVAGQQEAYTFEPSNPGKGWRKAGGSRPYRMRAYATPVLLPDESVLLVGGAESEKGNWIRSFFSESGGEDPTAITFAEQYFPASRSWKILADAHVPRVYHSTALLLADGRVWTAGSNHNSRPGGRGARELRIEVFSPPYLFTKRDGKIVPAPRPTISNAPHEVPLGTEIKIGTPDAEFIVRVLLIRCGSSTHAFDPDQRCIVLDINRRGLTEIVVTAPGNGAPAPLGYYLLFIRDSSGVPSIGHMLRIKPSPIN